jgi:hypothetical protein
VSERISDEAADEVKALVNRQHLLFPDWHKVSDCIGALQLDRADLRKRFSEAHAVPAPATFLVDPARKDDGDGVTGIYVRAKLDDKWGSYDIATLDRTSLCAFLRARGGKNEWAENTVLAMLGHRTVEAP